MDVANKRIWLLVLAVVLVPILPWVLLGPRLEPWATGLITGAGGAAGSREVWAAAGVGLLASDSFLPVPSTLVMSALGLVLGPMLGGLAASVGVFFSGAIAYGVCRRWGAGLARRIAGQNGLARVAAALERQGWWLIAATRSVPVVQEATACLAGVTRMPAPQYFAALAAGSVPTGFAYAAIGASALHARWWAVALSVLVPVITWPLVHLAVRDAPRPE